MRIVAVFVIAALFLVAGCTSELTVEEFERICVGSGGFYVSDPHRDYKVCGCGDSKTGLVYLFQYEHIKESSEFRGCAFEEDGGG